MELDGVWVVHLVQFSANRSSGANLIEDFPVRLQLGVRVRPPYHGERVRRVPDGGVLESSQIGGAVRFVVPELCIHEMVVLERS